MKNFRLCTLFSFFALTSAFASTSDSMSLTRAYELAIKNDSGLKSAKAQMEAGRERIPLAQSELLPQISYSLTRNSNDLVTSSNLSGQISKQNDEYYSYNKALTIRQPLINIHRWQNLKQAQQIVHESDFTFEHVRREQAIKVAGTFMEYLLSYSSLQVVQSQIRQYEALLTAANNMLYAGTGTRTDIDEARAKLDQARSDYIEASQNIAYTKRQLEYIIRQEVVITPELDSSRLKKLPLVDGLDALISRAIEVNPQIKAMEARVMASDYEIKKAQAGHFPTLDAVVQLSDSSNENVTSLNRSYENRLIGLQLEVPLYKGGAVQSLIRQAIAEKSSLQESLEDKKREIAILVHKEYRGVHEGIEKIYAQEQAFESARQVLISTQKSRAAGVRSSLDELNAEQQVTLVYRGLMQTRFNYLMSRLRLAMLLNEEPSDSIREIDTVFN